MAPENAAVSLLCLFSALLAGFTPNLCFFPTLPAQFSAFPGEWSRFYNILLVTKNHIRVTKFESALMATEPRDDLLAVNQFRASK